jgi:hypothetical protein
VCIKRFVSPNHQRLIEAWREPRWAGVLTQSSVQR